jgi:DedD protein
LNDVLKQRLVGALVIIVFGVLFWPMIFSDPNQLSLDRSSQVPAMPSLRKMQLETPEPIADIASAGGRYDAQLAMEAQELERVAAVKKSDSEPAKEIAVAKSAAATTTRAQPKPEIDDQGIPVAWVLQVVTVGKKSKAESLVTELIASGYKAYFRPIQHTSSTLYRVNVGPRFERKAIEEIKQVIDKELRVKSIIARYVP